MTVRFVAAAEIDPLAEDHVATGLKDDGGTYIVVSAHARNEFAAAISAMCGERGHASAR
jgi:hypothetical protein